MKNKIPIFPENTKSDKNIFIVVVSSGEYDTAETKVIAASFDMTLAYEICKNYNERESKKRKHRSYADVESVPLIEEQEQKHEELVSMPLCWKCDRMIKKQEKKYFTMIGCKDNPKIASYNDAMEFCPLINKKDGKDKK